ncbi:MAG: hypothetical protein V3T08_09070, partial [Gemmatimonadota bacterium]
DVPAVIAGPVSQADHAVGPFADFDERATAPIAEHGCASTHRLWEWGYRLSDLMLDGYFLSAGNLVTNGSEGHHGEGQGGQGGQGLPHKHS